MTTQRDLVPSPHQPRREPAIDPVMVEVIRAALETVAFHGNYGVTRAGEEERKA